MANGALFAKNESLPFEFGTDGTPRQHGTDSFQSQLLVPLSAHQPWYNVVKHRAAIWEAMALE